MSTQRDEGELEGAIFPIQTAKIGTPRVTWSPLVHQHFKEECFFLLLRIRTTWEKAESELRQCFDGSGVKAFSVYPLFGYYDALVRSWATPYRKARLTERIAELDFLDYAADFEVHKIHYDWAKTYPVPNGIAPFNEDIKTVTHGFSHPGETSFQKEYKRLVENGLLYEQTPPNKPLIKFYVLVRGVEVSATIDERLLEGILRSFVDDSPKFNIEYLSIYFGRGFGSALVKGIVDSYHNISPAINHLNSKLVYTGFKVTTLLVAGNNTFESEQLLTEEGSVGKSMLELFTLLNDPTLPEIYLSLLRTEQADIEEFYSKHASMLSSPFKEVLCSILCFKISKNKDGLVKNLSFLMEFEFLLRHFLIRAFSNVFGNQHWQDVIRQFVDSTPSLKFSGGPPARYMLGEFVILAHEMSNSNEDLKSLISAKLGSGWFGVINDLTVVRNDFAHGRMYSDDYKFPGGEEKFLNLLIRAGEMYIKLKK